MKKFLICIGIIIVFSTVSYSAETVTVTSPNGGERWKIGTTHNITWNSIGVTGNVQLQLHRRGRAVVIISNGIPASPGTFRWTIPAVQLNGLALTPASEYKVMVRRNTSPEDLSNSNFTILSQSSLPNVLQPLQVGTTKQRIQTGHAKQRPVVRSAKHPSLPGRALYPDLQILNMRIIPSNPTAHTQRLQCQIFIINKGAKASNPCALQLKIETNDGNKHYLSTRPLLNLPAMDPKAQVQKSFDYYLFLSAGTPRKKISGWYKNTVTIDPARTSGENGITRMNNTKPLPYRVTGFPRVAGCILKFNGVNSPVDIQIKNIGEGVMPASFITLRLKCRNCSNVDYIDTYRAPSPALQPGEHNFIQVHFPIDQLKAVLELTKDIPGADMEFHLDLDPEGLSDESRTNEQVTIYKECRQLIYFKFNLNACTPNN